MPQQPVLKAGHVAVITGGASEIGLATAKRLATLGLRVCIADLPTDRLETALISIRACAPDPAVIHAIPTDVSHPGALKALESRVRASLGNVHVLMNNAGIQPGSQILGSEANWQRIIDVNLWGIIRGTQAFLPAMLASRVPGLIINTGSKQGITTPQGIPPIMSLRPGSKSSPRRCSTNCAISRVAPLQLTC